MLNDGKLVEAGYFNRWVAVGKLQEGDLLPGLIMCAEVWAGDVE